jgi:hypothetical protein
MRKSLALVTAVALGGCTAMLPRHRALGVAADLSIAAGVGMVLDGESCHPDPNQLLSCLGPTIGEAYAAPVAITAGVVMGVIGLVMEERERADGAPAPRALPPVPTVVDPETRRLALLAHGAAQVEQCALAEDLVDEIDARDPVYRRILVGSGAVACGDAPKK